MLQIKQIKKPKQKCHLSCIGLTKSKHNLVFYVARGFGTYEQIIVMTLDKLEILKPSIKNLRSLPFLPLDLGVGVEQLHQQSVPFSPRRPSIKDLDPPPWIGGWDNIKAKQKLVFLTKFGRVKEFTFTLEV